MKFDTLIMKCFCFGLIMCCSMACTTDAKDKKPQVNFQEQSAPIAYDLTRPSEKYNLPGALKEISGLEYIGNGRVACIQDEQGYIFIYDLQQKKVIEKIKFAGAGDYEGIAYDGVDFFIIRSDGALYKSDKDGNVQKFDTKIRNRDIEGLAHAGSGKLLMVSKAAEGSKQIVYNLEFGKSAKPFFEIDMERIKERLPAEASKNSFHPSGIAIHPESGNIYLISSKGGKQLAIFSAEGDLIEAVAMDKNIFSQPEGITFKENGDMLISNEGKKGSADILLFKYQPVR